MKISEIIKSKKNFKIGFFGGSITEGSDASAEGNCRRRKFTEYIKAQYPETEIEEINAAIGGTGSDLGLFRMERDLLSKEKLPDSLIKQQRVADYYNIPALNMGKVFIDKLSSGKHTLSVRISEDKAEKSEGRFVRIGAFLVR